MEQTCGAAGLTEGMKIIRDLQQCSNWKNLPGGLEVIPGAVCQKISGVVSNLQAICDSTKPETCVDKVVKPDWYVKKMAGFIEEIIYQGYDHQTFSTYFDEVDGRLVLTKAGAAQGALTKLGLETACDLKTCVGLKLTMVSRSNGHSASVDFSIDYLTELQSAWGHDGAVPHLNTGLHCG